MRYGVSLALPDQKLIGWLLVVLAIVIFGFQLRYENGHVDFGWQERGKAERRPVIILTIAGVAFAIVLAWYLWYPFAPLDVAFELQSINYLQGEVYWGFRGKMATFWCALLLQTIQIILTIILILMAVPLTCLWRNRALKTT